MGVLSLTAGAGDHCLAPGVDALYPIAGADDLPLAADAGDLCSALAEGGSNNDPGVSVALPSVTDEPPPAPR